MTKITELTPEQQARMTEYRDKWINIGLSTAPANRVEAEKGIGQAYAIAGLKAPRIVWCGSPLSQAITRAICMYTPKTISPPTHKVPAGAERSVNASVAAIVWAERGATNLPVSVRDSVMASVKASIPDDIIGILKLSNKAIDRCTSEVLSSIQSSVQLSVGDNCFGQHDAGWLSFYEYFRDVCGLVKQTDKLAGLLHHAKHGGWFIPHTHICWAAERHNILNRDESGRLHNTSGPAVGYPDGWEIYAVHGIRVPRWIVMEKHKLSVDGIDNETNAEVRRVMLELFGLDRYLLTGKVLEQSGEYRLLQKQMPSGPQMISLIMKCPTTGAVYVHPVHPDVRSIDQALAWKRGIDNFKQAKPYKEIIRWEK